MAPLVVVGLTPGVAELNTDYGALGGAKRRDATQRLDLRVVPEAQIDRIDHAPRLDRRHFGEDQTYAPDRARAVVHHVPIAGRSAVHRRQLVHRGHHHAVAQRHAAQAQGLEQSGHWVLTKNRERRILEGAPLDRAGSRLSGWSCIGSQEARAYTEYSV